VFSKPAVTIALPLKLKLPLVEVVLENVNCANPVSLYSAATGTFSIAPWSSWIVIAAWPLPSVATSPTH
jgi:hypothetical protein